MSAGDKLDAGVSYYGPAPDPSEAAKVQATLMIHLAGLDTRVRSDRLSMDHRAPRRRKKVTYFTYECTNHAFHNDTSAERYNKAAAGFGVARTLRFFRKYLA